MLPRPPPPPKKLFPVAKHLSSGEQSPKLIKIDFSQHNRYGKRGQGLRLSFLRIQHRPCALPWEGTMVLGAIASCRLPSGEPPYDSAWTSVLTQGGTAREKKLVQEEGFYHHLKERELGCQTSHTSPGIIIVITVLIAAAANVY